MAQIHDGGSYGFNAAIYGRPHENTLNFLQQQVEGFSVGLTDAGQRFMAGARDVYERLSGSHAMRMMRAAGNRIKSMWQADEIRQLTTIAEFQHAPLKMQRWIMAEPTVRRAFHQQRCDGYSDSYVDMHPGDIGEAHYDHRRAMHGWVVETEDGDWKATSYYEDLLPGDPEVMILEEQHDIQWSMKAVAAHMRAGREDPVSKYGAEL